MSLVQNEVTTTSRTGPPCSADSSESVRPPSYAWNKKYAHLDVRELRRLRQVEEENSRLKRLVGDLSLDKHMLSEALRKKV